MILFAPKPIRRYIALLAVQLLAVLFAAGCSFAPSDDSGGTGSEIVGKTEYPDTNAAQKKAMLPKLAAANGFPVKNGRVYAFRNDFIPDTSWASNGGSPKAYTDTNGNFRVKDVPRGVVVVEGNDGMGRGVVTAVNVDKDSTTYDAGVLTLRQSGAATIQAHTSLPGRVRFYVSVKGTRCVVRGTLADVDVLLDNIPTGLPFTINIRVYEPVHIEKDFNNITIPVGGIAALGVFNIQ